MSRDFRTLLIEEKGGGLLKTGKRPLLQRVGFLLRSTGGDSQAAKVGTYLESRRNGGGFGKFGKAGNLKRRRVGTYDNVYTNRDR